jgi:hypothetical protein
MTYTPLTRLERQQEARDAITLSNKLVPRIKALGDVKDTSDARLAAVFSGNELVMAIRIRDAAKGKVRA